MQKHLAAGEIAEAGFTLIELLIVIVVLGILAATVIFALGGVTGQSAQAACNSDAKTVENAAQAYIAENGAQTAMTQADLTVAGNGINGTPYLHSWPSNPTHYSIGLTGTGVVTVTPTGGTAVNYDSQTSTTGCGAVS
jgi:general secretion pathway protein G